jgi:uncharacterized protein YqhQ
VWYNKLKEEVMRIEKKHFIIAGLGAAVALLLSFIFSKRLFISVPPDCDPDVIDV